MSNMSYDCTVLCILEVMDDDVGVILQVRLHVSTENIDNIVHPHFLKFFRIVELVFLKRMS